MRNTDVNHVSMPIFDTESLGPDKSSLLMYNNKAYKTINNTVKSLKIKIKAKRIVANNSIQFMY